MKMIKSTSFFLSMLFIVTSCVTSTEDVNQSADDSIDYSALSTTNFTPSTFNISLKDASGSPVSGIVVYIWDAAPLNGGQVIFKAITDTNGQISIEYNIPNHLENVIVETSYIGIADFVIVPVDEVDNIVIKGFEHSFEVVPSEQIPGQSNPEDGTTTVTSNARVAAASVIYPIGTYNTAGRPSYIVSRDVIGSSLLTLVNASLPEGKPVPSYHPAYLEDGTNTNLDIIQTADVWMTFVSEGAGYRNSLGYYTYPTGNPPTTPSDIDTLFIGFPNASFYGSGGELNSGDRIYLGKFNAGTTIGFVLVADGFDPNTSKIKTNARIHYSNTGLNPETNPDLQQHTVLLWDDVNQLFLIGFEDLNRQGTSDEDFNDAVFYITSNPITAISRENVKAIDKPVDTDGDGVNDTYDEFPNDKRYAYKYSYPGDDTYGTFAFEDQWPGYGDYDFNDMVIDYQFQQYANGTNKMVLLNSEFVLKATGAGFNNGFGFQINASPNLVSSVTGNKIFSDVFTFNSNGTEAGQSKMVIIATDNAHECFGSNGLINTESTKDYFTPDTIRVATAFTSPMALDALGSAPFNPFIVINKTRGRELHLPGYAPTDKVNTSYFGQGNDATDLQMGVYYKSQAGLPWGMNLPESFAYPEEKTDVRDAYAHFDQWAKSSGFSYMDWYTNKAGYRHTEKIYSKK